MPRPHLSSNTLRGLYIDILEGNAKLGEYFFEDYTLIINKKNNKVIDTPVSVIKPVKYKYKRNDPGMLDRHKKKYWKRRQEKVCTKCGEQDERTLANRVYCAKCGEKHNAYDKNREKERYGTHFDYYKKIKSSGKCIKCHTKERTKGIQGRLTLFCKGCLKKKREYDTTYVKRR